MKRMQSVLPILLVAAMIAGGMATAQQRPTIAHTTLKVGDMAPDFTLPDTSFIQVKLSYFAGRRT